jgi:formylglycine-generating enzyme
VLLFPMLAASLVLSTGADAVPVLELALSLDGVRGDTYGPMVADSRGAKKRPSKSRIHPKRKKREALSWLTQHHVEAALVPLERDSTGCAPNMTLIGGSYCIDIYEASLMEHMADGTERPWPYYEVIADDTVVRAVSERGVYPQGYISGVQAQEACERSGKRLCKPDEWRNACMGPRATLFPYGNVREVGRCNDNGRSSMRFFNPKLDGKPEHRWMWGDAGNMIDPRLNQLEGTLTRTGERDGCTNEYGVFDMVGNLHEWVDDPNGTFQGGYYLDTHINGDGCKYRTTAHPMSHYDYSTGFRCCADAEIP